MKKWAIYKGETGLYAMRYVDTLDGCKDAIGGHLIKKDDLPIVVNGVGGRHSFHPVPDNFVKIIEVEDGKDPLTREQCFPKNSPDFLYGWIATNGDTYHTGFRDHDTAAAMICKELWGITSRTERVLEEKGWIKISRPVPYTPDNFGKTAIYSPDGLSLTKKQADTLVELGYSNDEDFQFLMKVNQNQW